MPRETLRRPARVNQFRSSHGARPPAASDLYRVVLALDELKLIEGAACRSPRSSVPPSGSNSSAYSLAHAMLRTSARDAV